VARVAAQAAPQPAVVVVSPDGPVRTLAEALRRAPSGGRIVVRRGVYREPTIHVSRPVEIVGDTGAVLDGEGARAIMLVTADDVTVRGLRFAHVGTSYLEDRAALRVTQARRCAIQDNHFDDTFFGIYLAEVNGCRIERNVLRATKAGESESGNGIHLWSSRDVTIALNHITGHRDGIYFEFVHEADVRGNVSERNFRYGLHFMYSDDCRYADNTFRANGAGVAVMYTKNVTMTANRFEDNWGSASYGLLLKEISDARLDRNAFHRNTTGLLADGANRLVATGNQFIENGWAVKLEASTLGGWFTGNDFVRNTFDVATNSAAPSSEFGGNYWDAYRGYDLDRDGVGDVPFRPVRLFSVIVARNAPALILLRSAFVGLLDAAERVIPSLTPRALADATPAMRPNR
jgi:nitrous oxidase accessory protein